MEDVKTQPEEEKSERYVYIPGPNGQQIRMIIFKGLVLNRATERHIKRYWKKPNLWRQL